MTELKQFLSLLNISKRKLLIEHYCYYSFLGVLFAGGVSFMFALFARFFVVTHLTEKMAIACVTIFLVTLIIAFIKKPKQEHAADLFDTYVAEDRVKTALSFLHDESMVGMLQRRDALTYMKKALPQLEARRVKLFRWKMLFVIFFLFTLTTISVLVPNDVMKSADMQEIDEQIVKKAKKEIKKATEKDPQLKELEKQIMDMKQSKEILAELLEKEKRLEIQKQTALKEEKQLEELAKAMEELKNAQQKSNSKELTEAVKKSNEVFASLSKEQQRKVENMISQTTGKKGAQPSKLSSEQLNELLASLEGELNTTSIDQISKQQQNIRQLATSLNQNMANAGLSTSNQLAFASSGTNQPSGNSGKSQTNPSQNGQRQSNNGTGNGNGQGNGVGNGQGSGNGTGSGTNGGQGSGSGMGSGAGFGQGSRELTIPEKITGQETIENDFGQTGEGTSIQQSDANAPVLNGTVRPYEEVYGNYEEAYRESVNRMDLPQYLEDVVKDYFTDLNPEGE